VAGGGFAGVETVGSIKDFLHDALPYYPNLKSEMIRVVLVHPGDPVLPELGEKLGRYASRKLAERGVQLLPNGRALRPECARGSVISCCRLFQSRGFISKW
jgi:NADH:ubiquinone reductase (H+-translocating)